MRFVVLAASAALMLAAGDARAQDHDADKLTPPVAKPDKEKKLCRRITETGSILPHSQCHTKEEWAAIDGQNQSNTANFGLRSNQNGAMRDR